MKKVSNKKVMAVVVTYNRKELLLECIEALLNQDYDNCHILVIDNASSDGTERELNKYKKNSKFNYYNTGENLGGAGGFNYGIKKAYELGCDYIWIMDDDCIVHSDSLTKLLDADNKLKGNYGFLSSKVLWKDNSICKMNIQKRKFSKWLKDYDTNYQEIAMASFVSLFLKSSTIKKYGLPIKEFFIWTDDWEFTRRISRENKCYYISNSIVTHKSKENEGASIASVDDRLERFKYLYRNDCVLYRREGLKGKLLFKLRICLHKLRVLKSNKKDKKERIKIMDNAIKEGKKFYPKIEYVKGKKRRVLYMYGECLSIGGQESFTLNVLKNINKDKVIIDLFTPYVSQNELIIESTKEENGNIYAYNGRFENGKGNKKDFSKNTEKFLKEHAKDYDVVHIHSGSTYALAKGAKLAKKYGIRNVIVHSHATGVNNLKHKVLNCMSYFLFKNNVDLYCACSMDALYFKFSKRLIRDDNYAIIKNGIETDIFIYNEKIRKEYRKKLNIEDNFVITNVARLAEEKNLLFLVDVFNYIHKEDSKAVLLLVGDGHFKSEIEEKIKDLKLEKYVKLLGSRSDVAEILQASDIFVSTSFYEGLGISIVEAQASGLAVVCSSGIPDDAIITNMCYKIDLSEGLKKWATKILKLKDYKRKNTKDEILKKGYDVKKLADYLEEMYLNL